MPIFKPPKFKRSQNQCKHQHKRIQVNNELIKFRKSTARIWIIVTTPDVDAYIKEDFDNNIMEILNLLKKHIIFDYGILSDHDKKLNEKTRKKKQQQNTQRLQIEKQ